MSKVIESARLIYVSLADNHNKFYYMDLFDDGNVRIWYGRYSLSGQDLKTQSDETLGGGRGLFERKLREKTKKGYTEQPVVNAVASFTTPQTQSGTLEDIACSEIKTNSDSVYVLIKYLAQVNIHNIVQNTAIQYDKSTGLFSTPSGLITRIGIDRAKNLLGIMSGHIDGSALLLDFTSKVEEYLTIIPKDFGRRRVTAEDIFPDMKTVQSQYSVLESLEGSLKEMDKKGVPDDVKNQKPSNRLFDTSLELVTDQSEKNAVYKRFTDSAKTEHRTVAHLKLANVYRVDIASMTKPFDKDGKTIGNIHRLWHGTLGTNVLSILRTGYMISPPSTARIAGKNFGNGVYFAPASTKSLQYANGFWGGSSGGNKVYMFLNDVAVGKEYTPKSLCSSPPPAGYDSYWAKAGVSASLINDEVIVFKTSQCNPVYLLEFEA